MNRLGQWFANTRVRNKILAGYGIMLVLMLLMGLIVFAQATRITAANEENRRIEAVLAGSQQVGQAFATLASALRDYAITGQASALEIYEASREQLNTAIEQTRGAVREPAQVERLAQVVEATQLWQDSVAAVVIPLRAATLRPGGPSIENVVDFYQRGTAREYVQETTELLESVTAEERLRAEESRLAVDDALRSMRWAAILFTVLAALLAALVSVWIAAQISRPLGNAVSLAGAVAAGDLTQQAPPGGRDEVGLMISRLNAMASDLRRTVAGVSSASAQVASAAEQIATASEEISYTSDQQVRATEDTSSSMEEIASQIARVARSAESLAVSVEQISSSIGQMSNSVEQTAASTESLGASVEQTSATIEEMVASISQAGRHVEETRRIARDAESDASAGGGAVERTVESMRRLHTEMDGMVGTIRQLGATSESIGLISETIEGIADQTNLLALNAAIEAARAGEHGRGFAVVAQEIRRLAERAVESTREISTTVRGVREEIGRVITSTGGVAERAREGIEVADTAGQALEKIIDSAGRTRGLMEEVALATQQQIGAAEQAQEAIRHIQRVSGEVRLATREQAIGSRQIVEAVDNMNRQTQEVFAATAEQKRGGEMILESTENISQGARSTQGAIQEMTNAAQELSSQAMRLTELVTTFRV